MGFAMFMAGMWGRLLRVGAGLGLMAVGIGVVGGTGGIVLAAVGLVPLWAGVGNVCVLAPLLGLPFSGYALLSRGAHGH
ncbi:MAG: DUF2892 domain-containing protein [Myxococcaceae bacterium]|nr:DUF2892 domain-containing protein [Myxococcaceae bacterium]